MIVGISGASGKLGRLAVELALTQLPTDKIVASTRTPETLADLAKLGVHVRHGDFDDPASLRTAFAGVDRMFMVSASNATGKRSDQHTNAISAAKEAGVERLVFPSMPNVDDPRHPVGLAAREYQEAEDLVRGSGIPYAILRNAPYSELHVVERIAPVLASGMIRSNAGSGSAAFVSRLDVARAALAVLLDDDHEDQMHDITGPELLTYRQIADLLAEVTGHRVTYVELDDETYERETRESGATELRVEARAGMGRAVREGYFAVLTNDYLSLTGRDPLTLRTVLETHRDTLRAASRE